jgi:polyhydroxyalkanoate synthase
VKKYSDESATSTIYDDIDRLYQSRLARLTLGLSPAGMAEVYTAWMAQLSMSPGRLTELATFPAHRLQDAFDRMGKEGLSCSDDPRFRSEQWCRWPWRFYAEYFRFQEEFGELATQNISGLSPAYERAMGFTMRQMLDAVSPHNFLMTNPELAQKTLETGGMNLVHGAENAMEDLKRHLSAQLPVGMENFEVGKQVATAEGKVIYRNDLIELIQYSPQTQEVYKEPVLILPAWIMKYYILDLSPHNSLVKWLVAQGHTVFMVSWKNPGTDDRDKGMDDYVRDGALTAIEVVSSIMPETKIHLTGYCLGGTLAMITAALMAHDGDHRLKSLTLFAAQGDFTEAGELMLFINHSEVAYLKNMMWAQGYLDTKQMAGAFQMLHSNDLVWSHIINDYLMGDRTPLFDLMAWNADATRMPYRMHSEYLERLFLNNEFSSGRYTVMDKPIAPENITVPVFAVGTEKDHVAPWVSVHKIHLMAGGEVTFALTSGGHNAGIVSEPGHKGRTYHIATRKAGSPYQSPEKWLGASQQVEGSWWEAWEQWLRDKNDEVKKPAPKQLGNRQFKPLGSAPGTYVHQR